MGASVLLVYVPCCCYFAEVGKANGLNMLLDAETFDYTYHLKAGQGFKLSVHHHLDQPIMSIKGPVHRSLPNSNTFMAEPFSLDAFTVARSN